MRYKDQYPQISGPRNPSNPIFLELDILRIHDVFKLQVIKFVFDCLSFNTPQFVWNWFILNHTVHNYNTVSNTIVHMNDKFEVETVSESNILHTKFSNLVNHGAKILRVHYCEIAYLILSKILSQWLNLNSM